MNRQSFAIKDEAQGVVIEADAAELPSFQQARINGESGFFQKESIRRYRSISPVPAPGLTGLLEAVVHGGWKPEIVTSSLGAADSRFNGYDRFVQDGIEAELGQSVFSLLFRKSYTGPVAGNLYTSSEREEIETELGQPHFEADGQDPVFGYKLAPFYLFFAGAEAPYDIAIYQRGGDAQTGGSLNLAALSEALKTTGSLQFFGRGPLYIGSLCAVISGQVDIFVPSPTYTCCRCLSTG